MTIVTESIQIRSRGENDMIDITASASRVVEDSKPKRGIVTIFIAGSEWSADDKCRNGQEYRDKAGILIIRWVG
jgi:hypothetical protein